MMPPAPLKFAVFGTGFWARFQLAAWQEVGGVHCVALYNRSPEKAERLSRELGLHVPVFSDPAQLLDSVDVDFVDIITNVDTHSSLSLLAARYGKPVICQKPMAESYHDAVEMVHFCRKQCVPFYIHENWRWQTQIRALKSVLDSQLIGQPYRARIRMASGFPVFANQPFLKELESFLLMDIGSHILDVSRFLFGEPVSLYCNTRRVQQDIRGEDVATIVLKTAEEMTILCELGYAGAPLADDHFPQTFVFVEGERGSIELGPDYRIRAVSPDGEKTLIARPPHYAWADPCYDVVHSSIVDCQRDLLAGLRGEKEPETTGKDNLRTMRLVFTAYESARKNQVLPID